MSNENFFDFIIKFSSAGIEPHFFSAFSGTIVQHRNQNGGKAPVRGFSSGDEVVLSGKRPYFPEKTASWNGFSGKVRSFPEKIKTEEMDGRYSTEKSEPGAELCHGG